MVKGYNNIDKKFKNMLRVEEISEANEGFG